MAAPKLEVLLFSFEEETGSREDLSVLYAEPLAVLATTQDRDVIAAIIEDHISYSSADESYDRDFDRDKLLEKILDAGYSASWQKIEVFCNE